VPSHLVSRLDLGKLYPPFLLRYLDLLAACEKRGAYYYGVSAFRDLKEQDEKYALGRTIPGKIITKARGGFSTHNYGIATDNARDEDLVRVGLQTSWGSDGYEMLAEEGAKLGLQVGVPGLIDPGHVQLPLSKALKRTEKSVLLELRGIYLAAPQDQEQGLKRVWAKLDEWGFDR
jgi:hypothetical protein